MPPRPYGQANLLDTRAGACIAATTWDRDLRRRTVEVSPGHGRGRPCRGGAMLPRRAGGPAAAAACFACRRVKSGGALPADGSRPSPSPPSRNHISWLASLHTLRFDKPAATHHARRARRLHPPPAGHPWPWVWRASWPGMAATARVSITSDSPPIGQHKDDMVPAETKIWLRHRPCN